MDRRSLLLAGFRVRRSGGVHRPGRLTYAFGSRDRCLRSLDGELGKR
ncbi:hypothetical protein [Actinoplanes philippinensis]